MRQSKQILQKLPSGLKVMSLMFSSWLSQFRNPPENLIHFLPLLVQEDLREAELLLPASAHAGAVALHSAREINLAETILCALVR